MNGMCSIMNRKLFCTYLLSMFFDLIKSISDAISGVVIYVVSNIYCTSINLFRVVHEKTIISKCSDISNADGYLSIEVNEELKAV